MGGLLPVAIFIIVIMSILGVTMHRLLADAGRSNVTDVYGARADAAARSGAEIMLTQIFPLNAVPNATGVCVNRGDALNPQTITFQSQGLVGCQTTIACDVLELEDPYQGLNFRIRAEGRCEVGGSTYSKQLILEASHGAF